MAIIATGSSVGNQEEHGRGWSLIIQLSLNSVFDEMWKHPTVNYSNPLASQCLTHTVGWFFRVANWPWMHYQGGVGVVESWQLDPLWILEEVSPPHPRGFLVFGLETQDLTFVNLWSVLSAKSYLKVCCEQLWLDSSETRCELVLELPGKGW